MKLQVNMNEYATVVLTEAGRRIAAEAGEDEWLEESPVSEQLWKLFQVFGPHIGLLREVPFEGNEIGLVSSL